MSNMNERIQKELEELEKLLPGSTIPQSSKPEEAPKKD
jgi:hypothetical protein